MNPSKADSDANTLLATNQGTAVKSHSAVSTTSVQQWSDQRLVTGTDQLIEEVAVALVYNGISHVVMMVTPHELEAFALGFSLSEGILDLPEQLYGLDIHHQTQGIEIAMQISAECFARLKQKRRNMTGRTGCGLCGSESLEQVIRQPEPLKTSPVYRHKAIEVAVRQLEPRQPLQQQTGASHGAALCNNSGDIQMLCEDVGRHNALDKLYGQACGHVELHDASKRADCFVVTSSRASYELVLKSAAMGVGMLVAISAPTGLAVRIAEQANIILIGFARDGRHVVYTHADRVNS
ncbi:MAG: formate dehydrogenase accessory sulfurtransferase FdhD [Pseudomonadales bacterium]|nr:formate dehydrogenase accessory sulfurtransferase FdhD [Pseudomonadales bacterium]